jgi:hypothetical protein
MKRLFLMGVLALLAGEAGAETWPTNAFPSHLHWREQTLMNGVIYTAIVERAETISNMLAVMPPTVLPPPSVPTWYRSQRADLMRYKSAVSNWLDRQCFALRTSNESYTAFFNAQMSFTNGTYETIPLVTWASAFSNAPIPANYLAYTPWSCLNGLGPFTNDTTVGHGYGWEIAGITDTNIAGNNFPAGRDTWYSTDYGWDGMTGLLSQLVWLSRSNDIPTIYGPTWEAGFMATNWWDSYEIMWETCKVVVPQLYHQTNNLSDYANNYTYSDYYYAGSGYPTPYWPVLHAKANMEYASFKVTTTKPHASQYYFCSTWPYSYADCITNIYDGVNGNYTNRGAWVTGSNITDNGGAYDRFAYGIQCATNFLFTATNFTVMRGSTNYPPLCNPSSRNVYYPHDERGYSMGSDVGVNKILILFKFDGENGYKFW